MGNVSAGGVENAKEGDQGKSLKRLLLLILTNLFNRLYW
jgi:hypothetical protein